MSNDNSTSDPNSFLQKKVKVHSLSARPDLNGKIGVVTSYLPTRQRYLVALPLPTSSLLREAPNGSQPAPIALKADNLSPATMMDKAFAKVNDIKTITKFLYNDPTIRAHVYRVHDDINARLPPSVTPLHLAIALLILISIFFKVLGVSKTFMLFSFIGMLLVVMMPDISSALQSGTQQLDLRAILAKFPDRWSEHLTRVIGRNVSKNVGLGAFFLLLLLTGKIMFTPPQRAGSVTSTVPPNMDNLHHSYPPQMDDRAQSSMTIKEIYELGYEDCSANRENGSSLPEKYEEMIVVKDVKQHPNHDFDYPMDNLSSYPPPPPQPPKAKSFGIGSIMSIFAIGRAVKEMGFPPNSGRFDPSYFMANARNMEPWRLGLLAFAAYNLVRSIL
mmetsp:Transcript_14930/g.21365  ORF Transcript_14930/g.21365 Transcript_14930/m.21365 type:complete len:388 (-) Transcript_14930:347-1510(-)